MRFFSLSTAHSYSVEDAIPGINDHAVADGEPRGNRGKTGPIAAAGKQVAARHGQRLRGRRSSRHLSEKERRPALSSRPLGCFR
jgi:hypothetical protein